MTQMLSGSALAKELKVSKARVSQWTSEGKLDGCYSGTGRERRYDLARVAAALGKRLDMGQMMGNGAETRRTLQTLRLGVPDADDGDEPRRPVYVQPRDGSELPPSDAARYELARTLKAEEEARKLRRINAEAEGTFVLASEVRHQTARLMAQEIAEFEAVLRDGSRRVADQLGVDFKRVRQILIEEWRGHRAKRSVQLEAQASQAVMSDAEMAEDI